VTVSDGSPGGVDAGGGEAGAAVEAAVVVDAAVGEAAVSDASAAWVGAGGLIAACPSGALGEDEEAVDALPSAAADSRLGVLVGEDPEAGGLLAVEGAGTLAPGEAGAGRGDSLW
jgi:hypothetical protein